MAKLSKFMASLIAEQFLKDMNPTSWDGAGIKPLSFREQIWEYPLSGGLHLEVVYVFDELWKCCCDIVSGSESVGARTVCKINSKQDIAGAIYDLCQQKLQ